MADQGDQDRSEPATPYKLEEARKKGQVAKSLEVNSASALLIALLVATAFGGWITVRVLDIERRLFSGAHDWVFDVNHIMARLGDLGYRSLYALSPLLALMVIGALLSNLIQTGPVLSGKPLSPDFSRLNPATGLKRIFSVRTLFEAGKSIIKLVIYTTIAYFTLRSMMGQLGGLYQRAPQSYPAVFSHFTTSLLAHLLIGVIAIALIDLVFTRWDYARRMRMSKRELKDEHRRREGDPQVRRRRRELQRDMRKRSSSSGRVRDADVLVTNPEHYAIALKYRRGKAKAPQVIAKGTGRLAREMREIAFRYRVPISPNPPLARALYRDVALDREVPEKHYTAVADILHWAYKVRRQYQPGTS